MFTVRKREGGIYYEEIVCAASWEDAEAQAAEDGGEVTGCLGDTILPDFASDYGEWD